MMLTSSEENTTNGVPSFIVQEEFDRYIGYWWQHKKGFYLSLSQINLNLKLLMKIVWIQFT